MRAVGVAETVKVDADESTLADLLTSELTEIPGSMMAYANNAGGADNISAIVVEVVRCARGMHRVARAA